LVVSHEIHLKERPIGIPKNKNFELEVQIPEPRYGEVVLVSKW
jgi:NADPH-dependent curcumin reductase CurA